MVGLTVYRKTTPPLERISGGTHNENRDFGEKFPILDLVHDSVVIYIVSRCFNSSTRTLIDRTRITRFRIQVPLAAAATRCPAGWEHSPLF